LNATLRAHRAAPIALSFGAGLVQAASFRPFEAWWLQLAALATLVWLVLRSPERARWLGFAFGFGCFVAGVSWLHVSMHRYGGMPAVLAALALLLFAAYLAAFPAIACEALGRLDATLRRRPTTRLARAAALALLFSAAWALTEVLRGWLFTGFPWLAIGYAHVDGPLAGFAPLLGVYGVCLLAACVAFGIALALGGLPTLQPAEVVQGGEAVPAAGTAPVLDPTGGIAPASASAARAFGVLAAALPLVAGLALSALDWTSPHGAPLRVRLLQGNVPQDLKFDPGRSLAAMYAYTNEVLSRDVPLTILPETAWTVPWPHTPHDVHEAMVVHLQKTGTAVAIGMPLLAEHDPRGSATPSLTNSVGIIDRTGSIVWRYDKRHLVPFGEFVPFGFGWFVDLMHIPLGDFARGAPDQPPLPIAGQRIAFDICYEDLFGEEIAVQVRRGATILANVSNIAWFGDSHALPQHLQIARMRAIELARPMLRATNTGITAAIDARGRVLAQLEPYTRGALEIDVQGTDAMTPYARFGNAPVVALAVGCVALAGALPVAARRRTA